MEKLLKEYVKWRYSKEEHPELFRIGIKLGLGLMSIIAALFIFLK